jgi:hypothetical protein
VGWDRRLIEQGDYFYGFSHIPKYRLNLPAGTFTFTCLRDPIHRVLSHYRLLRRFERDEIPHPCMEREGKWLGRCLDDFLDNIPREDLLNQLSMFSESFDVNVAFDNIVKCSHFSFTEERARGLEGLSSRLGIHLDRLHANDAPIPFSATAGQLQRLRCELDAEYRLVEMLRRHATGPKDGSALQPQTAAGPGTSLLGAHKTTDMPGKSHSLREIGS